MTPYNRKMGKGNVRIYRGVVIFGAKCNEITSRGHTFAFDTKTKNMLNLTISYIYMSKFKFSDVRHK